MKKIWILFLVLPLLSLKNFHEADRFIGKWKGDDQEQIGFVSFDKEGYAAFEVNGVVFGGKNFEINGEKGEMKYEINTKVSPIEIDLIVNNFTTNKTKKMLCIAEFISDVEMKFAIGFTGERPQGFTDDNSIVLKKE